MHLCTEKLKFINSENVVIYQEKSSWKKERPCLPMTNTFVHVFLWKCHFVKGGDWAAGWGTCFLCLGGCTLAARWCCVCVSNHRVCWARKGNRSVAQGGESRETPAQATTVKYSWFYRVFCFNESFPDFSQPSLLELYWWMGCSCVLRLCRTTAEVSWGRNFFRF